MEPIIPDGARRTVVEARATLETAIGLLKELEDPEIIAFANDLQNKLSQLLAPIEWLEQQLDPILQQMDGETQAFMLWAW